MKQEKRKISMKIRLDDKELYIRIKMTPRLWKGIWIVLMNPDKTLPALFRRQIF